MVGDAIMSRIDEARRHWGDCFSAFRIACEWDNSAWYQAEDKQAWKEELTRRLHAISEQALKKADEWEKRGTP